MNMFLSLAAVIGSGMVTGPKTKKEGMELLGQLVLVLPRLASLESLGPSWPLCWESLPDNEACTLEGRA